MKKIIMALTAALFVATSASAFTLTGGVAYGHSAATKLNSDFSLTEESEAEEKIGFNLGLFNQLGETPFGWFTDIQVLFPLSTVSKTDDGTTTFTPTKQFNINGVLGPSLAFKINDLTDFHLGAGIDLNYNTKEYDKGLKEDIKQATNQTFNWGPALKADFNILLLGFIGVGISCDVGFLWGETTLNYDLEKGASESTKTNESYKNFTLLFVPSINAVIRL